MGLGQLREQVEQGHMFSALGVKCTQKRAGVRRDVCDKMNSKWFVTAPEVSSNEGKGVGDSCVLTVKDGVNRIVCAGTLVSKM